MRLLFKFIKEMFTEMGQMRVSKLALNPGKADIEAQYCEVLAYAAAGG